MKKITVTSPMEGMEGRTNKNVYTGFANRVQIEDFCRRTELHPDWWKNKPGVTIETSDEEDVPENANYGSTLLCAVRVQSVTSNNATAQWNEVPASELPPYYVYYVDMYHIPSEEVTA